MDLGPEHGTLTLHTGRAGAAAKVGHDLTLAVTEWSATVDPQTHLTLTADLTSLTVVRGEGGLKPLSEKDKTTILGHAADRLHAAEHPTVTVAIGGPTATTGTVEGTVTIAGQSRQVPIDIVVTDPGADPVHVVATATVLQSAFGIKPYSGLMGTLKVADAVRVEVDLRVPRA